MFCCQNILNYVQESSTAFFTLVFKMYSRDEPPLELHIFLKSVRIHLRLDNPNSQSSPGYVISRQCCEHCYHMLDGDCKEPLRLLHSGRGTVQGFLKPVGNI